MNDARALVTDGYYVIIVDVVPEVMPGQRIEHVDGILFYHIVSPGWFRPTVWKPWFIAKLLCIVLRSIPVLLLARADIYHAHVEHAFFATLLAARFWRHRLIFDTPELTLYSPPFSERPFLREQALRFIRWMVMYSDLHITGSPAYVPVLRSLYGDNNYRVIRHIPPRPFVEETDRMHLHERLELAPGIRIALYQGYLLPDRGLETLVRSASYLPPDCVIVLLGQSFGTMAEDLQELIVSLHVEDRVKILPPVPYDLLLEWIATADIGLLLLPPDYSLSIRKCLPNKFFEYLAAGLPILCSELEVVASLVREHEIGAVVTDLVPEQIAQAIQCLLQDREFWRQAHAKVLQLVDTQGLYWELEKWHLLGCYCELMWQRHSSLPAQRRRWRGLLPASKLFAESSMSAAAEKTLPSLPGGD
ncbi:glycosyltransferase family 4 protein [Ktedonobacteria bacterium brp13]|nr:glycosyltransferase family 4 protein [Ktedonobacteria bacterium brp13]